MAAKAILVLCASALFVQTISAQCIGGGLNNGIIGYGNGLGLANNGLAGAGLANGGCGCGLAAPGSLYNSGISTSGGGLTVTSSSPIAPSGITIISENVIEGLLDVAGQLPVLAAVGLEANLPTAGSAGVTYSCGNGQVGITSDNGAAGYGAGPNLANAGLNAGLANAGLNAGLANAAYGGQIGLGNAGLIGLNGIRGAGCGPY